MNENSLLKIALVFSILGILIILFLSETIPPTLLNIGDITKDKIDQKIRIQGILTNVIPTETVTILSIRDNTGEITSIFFENSTLPKIKQKVEIYGTVSEYEGELEIIADQIKTT